MKKQNSFKLFKPKTHTIQKYDFKSYKTFTFFQILQNKNLKNLIPKSPNKNFTQITKSFKSKILQVKNSNSKLKILRNSQKTQRQALQTKDLKQKNSEQTPP
jgi:hypothetical protein